MEKKNEKFGGTLRFKELMQKSYDRLKELSLITSEMIGQSISILVEDREDLYAELKKELEETKKLRLSLEESVVNSLTLHQPFAGDLRFLVSSLKIANELERTARDAVHIAHSTKYFDHSMECLKNSVENIRTLAEKSHKMFERSIDSFLERKPVDPIEWSKLDDEIDTLHKELIDKITQEMFCNGSEAKRAGVSLILTTRYIERIADHACNIVEENIYVVTGKRTSID